MALRDWISNSGRVATATVATLATLTPETQRNVATVATVSVARVEKKDKSARLRIIGHPAECLPTIPALPSWCNPLCDCYHRLEVPDVGTQEAIATQRNAQWCCQEIDETHWRRDRIDTMSGCPTERRQ